METVNGTRDNGLSAKTSGKEKECRSSQTELNTTDSGKRIRNTDTELRLGLMVPSMRANMLKESTTERADTHGLMVKLIMDNTTKAICMEKANTPMPMAMSITVSL